MKQYEAVIKTMEENGGFATLGFLYQKVLKVPEVEWKTKTPFASIRRIVQDERFFFKIKPGLWALKDWRNKLPQAFRSDKIVSDKTKEEFNHSYYQGLLVEIGNLKGYKTFVPNQDKNKNFLNKKLKDIINIGEFCKFSYNHIIHKAQTIDVSWFNTRKMPDAFFEIEYSTNFHNAFLKFVEFQDFNVRMFVVADNIRGKEFQDKLNLSAFIPIQTRVKFLSYDKLSDWHSKIYESSIIEKQIFY